MTRRFQFRASVLLNAVLAIAIISLVVARGKPVELAPPAAAPHHATAAAPAAVPAAVHFTPTATPTAQRRWLIDQLRAMGMSNSVLARIVLASLDSEWNKEATKVTLECRGDPATMAALQLKFDQSRDAEMRAALGEEGFREWDHANMLREADTGNVPLSGSETEAAYGYWKKLQQRELALRAARLKGTIDDAGVSDASTVAMGEFDREMRALLGDERYAKARQTDEDTATSSLRREMADANPTEAQFQALLQAQRDLNDRRAALAQQYQADPSSPAYAQQLAALDQARDAEYERVLGPNAFDAMRKAQDPAYAQMKKNETLWGLDDGNVDRVFGELQYFKKSVEEYQAQTRTRAAQGQAVDWSAVNQSIHQFAEQTQQSLKDYLGAERFNRLNQNGVFRFNEVVPVQ